MRNSSDLIPLCRLIARTRVAVEFEMEPSANSVLCRATAECTGQTGVEMGAHRLQRGASGHLRHVQGCDL